MNSQPDPKAPGFVVNVPAPEAEYAEMNVLVPDESHAIAFLNQQGNLAVPGGRYGSDTYSCSPVAYAVSRIVADATGEPMTYADLDQIMGQVVNSSDEVASLILGHGPGIGIDPSEFLDAEDLVLPLTEDHLILAREMGTQHGTSAGSWILDGNSSAGDARSVLTDIEHSELDIPAPLSGEWADDPTPNQILAEILGEHWDGWPTEDHDDLLTAYEMAFSDAYADEAYRLARTFVPTTDEAEEFFQAYVECALWSSTYEDEDGDSLPMEGEYGPDDLSSDALERMREDCNDFLDGPDESVNALEVYTQEFGYSRAGHDFWLTRNRHGAGFWDRHYAPGALYDACQHLTAVAKPYGDADLYIGDDGLIYHS